MTAAPIASIAAAIAASNLPVTPFVLWVVAALLVASVLAAVSHAEAVACRVGEPLGTIVVGVAVTVIEVALIVSAMTAGGQEKADLARDTVFASVMIVCNGVMGLCLLVGGLRHGAQAFRIRGASSALSVLAVLSIVTLVVPDYTSRQLGPRLTDSQLAFAGGASLLLYGVFIFVQTVRHRDDFLPRYVRREPRCSNSHDNMLSAGILLLACLVAVVLLAKQLSPAAEKLVESIDAPRSTVAIFIAALVLLPETLAALRAARANHLQKSLNITLGSALASIGLTIPAVAVFSLWTATPIALGINELDIALLALTMLVGAMTFGTGRTTILQGAVHLFLFATYLFLSLAPG